MIRNWNDLTENYGSPESFFKELKDEMLVDLDKAWEHISKQKDKTNREYWFMTEWFTSIENVFKGLVKDKNELK